MQVKVCPKCKAENRSSNASCSNCYSSLEGVPLTASQKSDEPAVAGQVGVGGGAPAQRVRDVGAADRAPGQVQSPYGPPGHQPGTSYSPPFRERPQPAKQGSNPALILLVILLLAGGAFSGWWFFLKAPTPEQTVERYFNAAQAGDYEKMKACLTEASIQKMKSVPGGEEQVAKAMKAAAAAANRDHKPVKEQTTINEAVYEGEDKAIVGYVKGSSGSTTMSYKLEKVLLREGNRWKIDIDESEKRLAAQFRSMMKNSPPANNPQMPNTLPKSGG